MRHFTGISEPVLGSQGDAGVRLLYCLYYGIDSGNCMLGFLGSCFFDRWGKIDAGIYNSFHAEGISIGPHHVDLHSSAEFPV